MAAPERTLHTRYDSVEAYVTKDGSLIRELMHPNLHGNSNSSVAEAIVGVGQTTNLHNMHHKSEEIYHITSGSGMMELGEGQSFLVQSGDTVCIDPETKHSITNDGNSELKFLAISSPPYQHSDTELVDREN